MLWEGVDGMRNWVQKRLILLSVLLVLILLLAACARDDAAAGASDGGTESAAGLYSIVSDDGTPLPYLDRLMAFTFAGMLVNVLYLWNKRKKLLREPVRADFWPLAANAVVLIVLHGFLWRMSMSHGFYYDTSPDGTLLGEIGKWTGWFITPLLFILVLVLCIDCAGHAKKAATQDEAAKQAGERNIDGEIS